MRLHLFSDKVAEIIFENGPYDSILCI